jgi:inositol phosphorylceramide mannosyltransferase catalytic subunit
MHRMCCRQSTPLPVYPPSQKWLHAYREAQANGIYTHSTLFTLQPNRSAIRVLSGPSSDPHLHMLNGYVDTPLFRHLGTSSWHSFDAFLITLMGTPRKGPLVVLLVVTSFVLGSLAAIYATMRVRVRSYMGKTSETSSILKAAYKNV